MATGNPYFIFLSLIWLFLGTQEKAEKLDALLYLETELPWNLSAGFAMPDRELCFRLELNMDEWH